MKKAILLISIFFSISSYGQVSIGLSAGIIAPVYSNTSKMKAFAGVSGSAELVTPLYKSFKLRTGVSFYSLTFEEDTSIKVGQPQVVSNSAYYLAVPVGIRYIYEERTLKPFIEAGVVTLSKVHSVGTRSAASSIVNPYITLGVKQSWDNKMYFCASIHTFSALTPIYKEGGAYYFNGLGGYLTLGYDF